jgi:uncharacterized RDD family membrane protein YckC
MAELSLSRVDPGPDEPGIVVAAAGQDAPGAPGAPSAVVYGGIVTRTIAIVIDALVIDAAALSVTGAVLLLRSVFAISGKHHALAVVTGGVLFFVWVAVYFIVFWTTTGQTPGSRVMQIRVARPDGTRLGVRRALVRLAWMVLSLPLLWGYWPILWTRHRRTVFDRMAGTVVTVAAPAAGIDLRSTAGAGDGHPSGMEPPTTVP